MPGLSSDYRRGGAASRTVARAIWDIPVAVRLALERNPALKCCYRQRMSGGRLSKHLCEISVWKVAKSPAVLVVEDEALIRLGAVRMIENAGFEVIEAASADEAIQILESRSDIRVVFTDIHMPGSMNGLKLAHAVRHRWPPIKIVVTSGRETPTELDLPEGGRFFPKPYDPTQVCETLRELAL
jgi:CheY-like chemotaxis protein